MKNNSNRELEKRNFSVAIFGSSRIAKGDANYKLVYNLAKMISKLDIDIVTGGGPGLMNAASEGHHTVRQTKKPQSIGLRIKLNTEEKEAAHLDNLQDQKHRQYRLHLWATHMSRYLR